MSLSEDLDVTLSEDVEASVASLGVIDDLLVCQVDAVLTRRGEYSTNQFIE